MPILKKRLSRSAEAEHRRCLREMYAEGVSVSEDFLECVPSLDISVVGGLETLIFNLPSGLAGYAIWLRMVAKKSRVILPEEFEITTEFDEQIVLESFDRVGPYCHLGQCSYHKSELLNNRFPLKFRGYGDLIVGVILATGLKPIPAEYLQGMVVPFTLSCSDQFGNKISVNSTLSTDRSTTPRTKLGRPGISIFSSLEIPETRIPLGSESPGPMVTNVLPEKSERPNDGDIPIIPINEDGM